MFHRRSFAGLLPPRTSETAVDGIHAQIVEADASNSVFRGAFLNYAELLQQVESLKAPPADRDNSGNAGSDDDESDEHAGFLSRLHASCSFVSSSFETVASNLVRSETGGHRWLRKHVGGLVSRVAKPNLSEETRRNRIRSVAKQCLDYAEVNRQALRAVVDKYENLFGTGMAASFIRECLQPTSTKKQAFLVSPLKEELAALTLEPPKLKSKPPTRFRILPPLRYKAPEEDLEPEFESESGESVLQCPICFDVKYQPVGLACGHSFCWTCLSDASKLTMTVTKTHALKLRIADEHIKAACPLCKSTGVFMSSLQLKAVDAKASERFPRQYKEKQRLAAEREKLILHAFVHQHSVKLTANGLELGDPVPGGWTHRRIGTGASPASSGSEPRDGSGASSSGSSSSGSSSGSPSPTGSIRGTGHYNSANRHTHEDHYY